MDGFQRLTIKISKIQKTIQKIKALQMTDFGLKGAHAICISFLVRHPEGLTATQLCEATQLDKAAVSRLLKDLEEGDFILYEDKKRYRSKIFLTEQGKEMAASFNERILTSINAGKNTIKEADLDAFYRTLDQLTENLELFYQSLALPE